MTRDTKGDFLLIERFLTLLSILLTQISGTVLGPGGYRERQIMASSFQEAQSMDQIHRDKERGFKKGGIVSP